MSCDLQPIYYKAPTISLPLVNTDFVINVKDYGAKGTNIDNDTKAIDDAIIAANTKMLPLYVPAGFVCKYVSNGDLTLPRYGLIFRGYIRGVRCAIINQANVNIDSIRCDDLLVSGMRYSFIHYIDCKVLTIDSNTPDIGTYWNTFGFIFCEHKIINLNKGSVNQNNFLHTKVHGVTNAVQNSPNFGHREGALYITGGIANQFNECHNNVWHTLDSSSYGLNSTGVVVLNDSLAKQTNIIQNLYSEMGGAGSLGPFIDGNWNILNSNIDTNGNAIRITPRNYSIFSGTQSGRSDGDFIPAGVNNLLKGGEWDELNSDWTSPLGLGASGAFPIAASPIDASTCPSGINNQITRELKATDASSAYQSFNLNFNFTSPKKIVVALWYKGNDFIAAESNSGSSSVPNGIYTDPVSGWKLLRMVMPDVTTQIKLWVTLANPADRKIAINSVFATDQKTVFLPTLNIHSFIPGVSNTVYNTIDPVTGGSVNYNKTTVYHDGSAMDDTKVDNNHYKKFAGIYYRKASFNTLSDIVANGNITSGVITVGGIEFSNSLNVDLSTLHRDRMMFTRNDNGGGVGYPAPYSSMVTLYNLRLAASYTVANGFYVQRYSDAGTTPGWMNWEKLITNIAMQGIADVTLPNATDLQTTMDLVNDMKTKLNLLFQNLR